MKRILQFNADGTVVSLHSDELSLEFLGKGRLERASHIEPVSTPKRLLFHLIRTLCGEGGAAASWTRRWSGPWRVRINGCPPEFSHASREACIEWEVRTLNERLSLEKTK